MVAEVPPVPAVATIHAGSGNRSNSQLLVDGFGDVVVPAPVRGALRVGELVHVVAAGLDRERGGLLVHPPRVVHEVALPAVELDQAALLRARGAGHDRDERHADELGEVGLGDGGGTAGRLDHRAAGADPAVAQAVEEERAGQPVLEAAGRVGRLVLEVEIDAPGLGQREAQQVGVRGAVGVGLDLADGLFEPAPVGRRRCGRRPGFDRSGSAAGVLTAGSSRLAPTPPDRSAASIINTFRTLLTCINTPLSTSKAPLGPPPGRAPRGRIPAFAPGAPSASPCALVLGAACGQTAHSGRSAQDAVAAEPARTGRGARGRSGMAEPEFTATGVRIGKRLRSLTRAGQVRISDGRLQLLTSYGSEIDSAPVQAVRASRPWFAARGPGVWPTSTARATRSPSASTIRPRARRARPRPAGSSRRPQSGGTRPLRRSATAGEARELRDRAPCVTLMYSLTLGLPAVTLRTSPPATAAGGVPLSRSADPISSSSGPQFGESQP